MTSRDRVINTIFHHPTETPLPRVLTIPSWVYSVRTEECDELRARFVNDLEILDYRYFTSTLAPLNKLEKEPNIDSWNCQWRVDARGIPCFPVQSPIRDLRDFSRLTLPENPVTPAIQNEVAALYDETSKFMLVQTRIRPLRRMQALFGTQRTVDLFRTITPQLKDMIKRLQDYYMAQVDAWCNTPVDAVCIGDNWAEERRLIISVDRWEELFMPFYIQCCEKLRAADKIVYFTSSGCIEEILPHLITAGVDVVRYVTGAMNHETLGNLYAGKLAFHAVLNPLITSNGTWDEIQDTVLGIRSVLSPTGCGLIGECVMTPSTPQIHMSGAMNQWRREMPVEA